MATRIVIFFNLLYFFKLSYGFVTENNVDLDILNQNLFESLRLHPKLNDVEGNLTEETKEFINKYVDDYFDLTVGSVEDERNQKPKRSLNIPKNIRRDRIGTYNFNGLHSLFQIPVHDSSKLEFFQQGGKWYVAALEHDTEENHMNFLIFKFKDNKIARMPEWMIPTVVAFSTYSEGYATYLAIKAIDGYYSGVWHFDGKTLNQIQNLDFQHATDMKIWSSQHELHMAVSSIEEYEFGSDHNRNTNSNKTLVYKWEGRYFDPIQSISESVTAIATFRAENDNFIMLIINGTQNDFARDYSEIYRYNLQSGQYEIHQRIPTYNCKDIEFFTLKKQKGYDSYLAVANYFSGENDDEIPSIIYKYVDGYFLPFQNLRIENCLQFESVKTPDEAFLLIARTEFQSLKTYQFDGWTFQESPHDINTYLPKVSVTTAESFVLGNVPILLVGFSDEHEFVHLYKIDFFHDNQLEQFQDGILTWCRKNLEQLELRNKSNPTRKKRDTEVEANESSTEQISESSEEIRTKINSAIVMLEELEDQVVSSLQGPGPHVLQDIEAEEIIIQNSTIHSLSTEFINNENIDEILENLIDTNQDAKWTDGIILRHALIDSKINPKTINGRNAFDMINNNDNLKINQLNVDGNVFSESIITGTLNNIPFDQNHILVNELDQKFDNLNVDNVRIQNLNPRKINSRDMRELKKFNSKTERKMDHIKKLKTKKLIVGGFLNQVDMRTLHKYSLKVFGDQTITEKYFFEELQANNMDIEVLSRKNLVGNVALTNSGEYQINQDVQFTNNLTVNNLVVRDFLDLIPVVDGKLQILLKDTEDLQRISAKKTMEDVELLNAIKLQGNIQSEELDKINPVINVDGPFVFEGDFEITGNTTIEKMMKTEDIISTDKVHSAKRVLSDGLQLREKEIGIHLNFQQQLNVDEIFIDKVNGINPQTWVVTGTRNQKIIHGAKVFAGDVTITGNTNFYKINNIEVSDLEHSVLRVNGEQIISGKHTILNVVANRVLGNNTTLGTNRWEDILTTNTEQMISGTTIINSDVISNISKSNTLNIRGLTDGLNFNSLIEDTVLKNSNKPILGHKTFKNFTTANMRIPDLETMDINEIIHDGDIRLENAAVENIHFMKTCNDVEQDKFGVESFGDQMEIVADLKDFDSLIVHGNVYIESGYLNDVYLQDFVRDTVKIDEDNVFNNAVFEDSIYSEEPVILHGHIEKVDLDNLIQPDSDEVQIVLDSKTFENNVTVFGNVMLEGAINDFNLSNVCDFAAVSEKEKEIEIHGNAIFTKGPNVHKILNITVRSITDEAWFRNKAIAMKGFINFKNVSMYNNVTVNGSVDGVQLDTLRDYYFSKTKDQTHAGGIYFANHVNFLGNLISPQMALNGVINHIKMSEISRTILLQDEDQIFEEVVYFEDVHVGDLEGEYTVNNLNLETDLLRYDKDNIVTGKKELKNLEAQNIELKDTNAIQDVEILDWMRNAILKRGVFSIEKRKIFRQNAHFAKGISMQGSMNGEPFTNETIMLKSVPQSIKGVKRFELDKMEMMKFKNVKLKGLLNDMQISELFSDQTTNEDLIFKSPMHFHTDISMKNLNLKKPYKGVNISKTILDIYDLEIMDDLVENYGKLLNMSRRINKNLKEQAFYLQSYRELQEIENPDYIIKSCCDNPTLMYFENVNGSYIMYYYYWDEDAKRFMKLDLKLDMGVPPLRIEAFTSERQQFLYMEYPIEGHSEGLIKGQIWKVDSLNQLSDFGSIKSNGISQIRPLSINDSECLLTIHQTTKPPHIFCDFDLKGKLKLYQALEPGKYIQSTITKIEGVTFIILVNSQEDNPINPQGSVEIWCVHEANLGIRQVLYLSDPPPRSTAAITYRGVHYLSIAYRGGLQQGHVDILRFSKLTGIYEQWQRITLNNPIAVEFGLLPSEELLLYVLGSPNQTLTIYKYSGISGFEKQSTSSSLPGITGFKQFTLNKEHFILLEYGDQLRILQAQFKGNMKKDYDVNKLVY